MLLPDSIVLIDAYAQIYRTFYGVRMLTNQRDEPVNAVYGMARLLLKIDQDMPATFGALVFDKGKCQIREALLPDYKANRKPMPEEMRPQIPVIREFASLLGWPIIEWEGHEADDLIAAISDKREGRKVQIFTGDKDLAQLVNDQVQLVAPGPQGTWKITDPEAVQEKFDLPASAILDYLAMLGDTADNIPGIEGIGKKTAAKLLNEYGDIEAILSHANEIKSARIRNNLVESSSILKRNRQLVALDRALPPDWSGLEDIRRQEPDWKRLLELAKDNDFKTLTTIFTKKLDDYRNPSLF